jgi:hypothetical protein
MWYALSSAWRSPSLVTGLQQMLERDLADWARAPRRALQDTPRRPLSPDVTHCHTLQYRRAFAAVGGAEVIALMKAIFRTSGLASTRPAS